MTYASLLNQVASSDPITRIQWVAAFAVSSISPNLGRMSKPFNPLLGMAFSGIQKPLILPTNRFHAKWYNVFLGFH